MGFALKREIPYLLMGEYIALENNATGATKEVLKGPYIRTQVPSAFYSSCRSCGRSLFGDASRVGALWRECAGSPHRQAAGYANERVGWGGEVPECPD